ncbi:hypothetical protein APR04_002720 [Promicromonospora umidemergens]|uniref:Uncharacterized protein n=1 Tax=Promicromonospora umidemergens TaxID=629679 RepID=A0ABP8WHM8_9MICO|nr:hypothetical protein [Promicromonospora umidemergens]MCP2283807.1 hypothetical protein [Promicromonospora umidemergens]
MTDTPDDTAPSVNLQPGIPAPESGTYVCGYCGPAGLAELLVLPMQAMRAGSPGAGNVNISGPLSGRMSVYTIAAATRLPKCPTCGPATGWDLLVGAIDEYLQSRSEARARVFEGLGIAGRVGRPRVSLDGVKVITAELPRTRRSSWLPWRRR